MTAITNANIFANDIRGWNEKTLLQKTRKSFKLHFYQSQKSTKKAQTHQSLSNIVFHQSSNAKKIANEVYARITAQQYKESARAESITAERLADQKMKEQMKQVENSTQQTKILLEQINYLTSTIKNLKISGKQ